MTSVGANSAWRCAGCPGFASGVPFAVEDEAASPMVDRMRGTIGVAGVLGHARVERGDPRSLLLDDGEQMDDHLPHDKRGLCPTGRVKRKPCGKWREV